MKAKAIAYRRQNGPWVNLTRFSAKSIERFVRLGTWFEIRLENGRTVSR